MILCTAHPPLPAKVLLTGVTLHFDQEEGGGGGLDSDVPCYIVRTPS